MSITAGRERDRLKLVYGSILNFKDGAAVKKGDVLAEWDPYSNPIIADVSGTVRFDNIEEGVTMAEQVDAVTGFSTKVITDSKGADAKPTVSLIDGSGKSLNLPNREIPARYVIPVGAQLLVSERERSACR